MSKLVVEIINRANHIHNYLKFDNFPIKMGRAYDNDLIIPDPYICENHLIIWENKITGKWTIEDFDSVNGIYVNGKKNLDRMVEVGSGDEIKLGRSILKLVEPSHPVPESIKMDRTYDDKRELLKMCLGWGGITLAVILACLQEYFHGITNVPLSEYLITILLMLLIPLVWIGGWSFMSKLVNNHSHYKEFLFTGGVTFGIYMILDLLGNYLVFVTGSNFLQRNFSAIMLSFVVICTIVVNRNIFTHTSIKQSEKTVMVALGVFLSILFLIVYLQFPRFSPNPQFVETLYPPAVQFGKGTKIDTFIKRSDEIFQKSPSAEE